MKKYLYLIPLLLLTFFITACAEEDPLEALGEGDAILVEDVDVIIEDGELVDEGVVEVVTPDVEEELVVVPVAEEAAAVEEATPAPEDAQTAPEAEVTPTPAEEAAAATPTPAEGAQAEQQPPVQVVAENIAFVIPEDNEVTVAAGSHVVMEFTNRDAVPHNWAAYRSGDAQEAIFVGEIITGPGATITYEFDAPTEPGNYYYQCDVHPQTMTGDFIVE